MKLTTDEINYLGTLARLRIDEEMMSKTDKALNDILGYVEELESLDLEGVKPMAHAVPLENVFRKDVVKEPLSHEMALMNAPEEEEGYFKVPRVIQD